MGHQNLDRPDGIGLKVRTPADEVHPEADRIAEGGDIDLAPLPGQRHGDHGHQLDIEDSLELPGDPQGDIEVLDTDRTADVQMAPHRGGATQQEPIEFLPDPLRHTFGIEPAGRLGLHPCLDSPSEIAGGVRGDLCRECLVEMGMGFREGREEHSPADVHTWRIDSRGIDVVGDHHARLHEQVDSATVDHTVRDHQALVHEAMVGVSDVPVATVPSVSRRFDDLSGPEVGDRIIASYDPDRANAVFDLLRDSNVWQCPTLTVSWNVAYWGDDAELHAERARHFPKAVGESWSRWNSLPVAAKAGIQRQLWFSMRVVGAMQKRGVRILGTIFLVPRDVQHVLPRAWDRCVRICKLFDAQEHVTSAHLPRAHNETRSDRKVRLRSVAMYSMKDVYSRLCT